MYCWRCSSDMRCSYWCVIRLSHLFITKYFANISHTFVVWKETFIWSQFRKWQMSRRVVRKWDLFILEWRWLNPFIYVFNCSQAPVLMFVIARSRSGLNSVWLWRWNLSIINLHSLCKIFVSARNRIEFGFYQIIKVCLDKFD